MIPLLEMKNVSFFSKESPIIKKLSISVKKGSVVTFIGDSGAGKTTSLKLLAGILTPFQGEVLFNGTNISNFTPQENKAFRKKTAFVFQNSALWQSKTIYTNLEIPLLVHFPQLSSSIRKRKIEFFANLVNYKKNLELYPSSLSIGEQKKIAFARALITKPEILFLDECTESVDYLTRQKMISILNIFVKQRKTLIYVSHDSEFIHAFPGEKYYFKNGNILH